MGGRKTNYRSLSEQSFRVPIWPSDILGILVLIERATKLRGQRRIRPGCGALHGALAGTVEIALAGLSRANGDAGSCFIERGLNNAKVQHRVAGPQVNSPGSEGEENGKLAWISRRKR
jgi:hypothetical protein